MNLIMIKIEFNYDINIIIVMIIYYIGDYEIVAIIFRYYYRFTQVAICQGFVKLVMVDSIKLVVLY